MTEMAGNAAIAQAWLVRSAEALVSAEESLVTGRYFTVANRLYYAAFYALSAALAVRGFSYHKHSAARAALHRELVRPGLVSKESGTVYDDLFEMRSLADYEVLATLERDELAAKIVQVRELVVVFRQLASTENRR